jgi:hypothetical protein
LQTEKDGEKKLKAKIDAIGWFSSFHDPTFFT